MTSISNCILFLLTIILQFPVVQVQVSLHHTDLRSDNALYYDCWMKQEASKNSEDITDLTIRFQYQLIPHCIRPFHDKLNSSLNKETFVIHGTPILFETLKIEKITSQDLYLSYAPIDVAERYQAFLEEPNSNLSKEIFYNCSSPWFGQFCQYIIYSTDESNKFRRTYFGPEEHTRDLVLISELCYIFLICDRGPPPLCLDWREICDGKIDCLNDGIDELGCDELDLSECAENEFRCTDGFCIPKEFFNDDSRNPDCMDRSDEKVIELNGVFENAGCSQRTIFRCDETKCRNERYISCGNGECSKSGCTNNRHELIRRSKFYHDMNYHLTFDCWISLLCLTNEYRLSGFGVEDSCSSEDEIETIYRQNCPSFFFFPAYPIILNHVYFVYVNHSIERDRFGYILPHYVCYDQQLCDWLPAAVWLNGSSCRLLSELNLGVNRYPNDVSMRASRFFLKCSTTKTKYVECPKSKPYRCANSTKCLSLSRLFDGFPDCFLEDDENITNSCSLPDAEFRFQCTSIYACVPISIVTMQSIECERIFTSLSLLEETKKILFPLSFQLLCDGFVDNEMIDGLNYTDEMNCEHWPCINAYTRCDRQGILNCPNGADEAVCSYNPCRPDGLPCISPLNYSLTCLPLPFIKDGYMDCLSGYDEPPNFRYRPGYLYYTFRCLNTTRYLNNDYVCSEDTPQCPLGDDQGVWCRQAWRWADWIRNTFRDNSTRTQNVDTLKDLYLMIGRHKKRYMDYSLKNHNVFPLIEMSDSQSDYISASHGQSLYPSHSIISLNRQKFDLDITTKHCHKGLPIFTKNGTKLVCLCPPAYFGDQCQYQNQRVSLTVQFRVSEWRKIFTFIVLLIDEDRNIHSVEQVEFIPVRDCRKKFTLYLLYLTQPKNMTTNYYIRVDTYDKVKMEYYNSMIYPVRYTFLPVHRLSFRVNVPVQELLFVKTQCPLKCVHGRCTYYSNSNQSFCQCSDGYSGVLCTDKITCNCAQGSLCIGMINKQSICLCPLEKFGQRCYLRRTECQSNSCLSSAKCIPVNKELYEVNYYCLCHDGYSGTKCENNATKIEFIIAKTISIPQSILIHLVYVAQARFLQDVELPVIDPIQTTIASKIKFDQNSTFIYYSGEFNLIFVQPNQDFYLVLIQKKLVVAKSISTTITPEYRCASTKELFNQSILSLPRWHRAKYYHIPCQNHSKLACFYDDDYFMCLCDNDRHANCFKFTKSPISDCSGYNYCLNGGRCYHDNNTCPTSSLCVCEKCYFGRRCQFTSTGFGLSLDDILGYSIQPNITFSRQPAAVKISASFTILMFIVAIVNSVLSIITFQTKRSLEVGCGHYLLASSITSLATMTVFSIKFLILLLSQMSIVINHSYLRFNCITIDFLLKALSATGDWLNACVGIERAVTVQLGVQFNKKRSIKVAKWLICGIYIVTFASFIHVPVHQYLLNDVEDERRWCVVRYSSSVRKFASFMNAFQFLLPFAINFISIVYLVIVIARRKSRSHHESYREHLWKQLSENKHRLLSSAALIVIAIPRLIISVTSTCMESAQNLWLYLGGYFVSFVPPLLVFILFVMPSKFYRRELNEATVHFARNIRNRIQ